MGNVAKNQRADFCLHEAPQTVDDLPTVYELEYFMRQSKCDKAMGYDVVPGELLHYAAPYLASKVWPVMAKMSMWVDEPPQWKGGRLITAFKNKESPAVQCTAPCTGHSSVTLRKVFCLKQNKMRNPATSSSSTSNLHTTNSYDNTQLISASKTPTFWSSSGIWASTRCTLMTWRLSYPNLQLWNGKDAPPTSTKWSARCTGQHGGNRMRTRSWSRRARERGWGRTSSGRWFLVATSTRSTNA